MPTTLKPLLLATIIWAAPWLATLAPAEVLVHLDATGFSHGPLATWPNEGSLGGTFTREFDTPSVASVDGVRGVRFDGNRDWFVGPPAPASITVPAAE